MAASGVALLGLLVGLILLASIGLAFRYRLPFKIGMRNVRRGGLRTILVVLGLLVGTTIISGSLVIGDTVSSAATHFAYQAYGYTDEGVFATNNQGGYTAIPSSVYSPLLSGTASDSQIRAISPEVQGTVQAFDRTTHIPQAGLNLVGANASASGPLGSFVADNGTSLAGPGPGHVFLDDLAAQDLNASVGDVVVLYGSTVSLVSVSAVVHDDNRGGYLGGGNVFTDLATAQPLENLSGTTVNFLAVTNAGSLSAGVGLSDSVSQQLNATLKAIHAPPAIAAHELLQRAVNSAQTAASSLESLFLVLGLFSIVAGAMLVVGIFVMLAEERKGEMGMLRAVGLRRRQLVMTYYFEGLAYSAGSALAGTLLGIVVGYGLVRAYVLFAGTGQGLGNALIDSFAFTGQSLVISYFVGFLLTLVVITIASSRVSRLNIVRAIRSQPEPPPPLTLYTKLAYLGVFILAISVLVFLATAGGTGDAGAPIGAVGVGILGLALVLTRFARNRVVFTAAGAALIVWAGFPSVHRAVLGNLHSGSIDSLFVEGILMILGAILLYAFNATLIVAGISALTRSRPKTLPVVKVGLSYPGRKGFRTAINLAIFSLVLFTIVAVAAFGASFQGDLDSIVQSESGGYTFLGVTTQSVPNLPQLIQNNSTLRPLYTAVVPIDNGAAQVDWSGQPAPFRDSVNAAPVGVPAFENFYSSNQYNFTFSQAGMSAADVWNAIATKTNVAVVDGGYAPGQTNFGGGGHPTLVVGTSVNVTNPDTGRSASFTVIGIMFQTFDTGVWINPTAATSLGYNNETNFLLRVAPGVSSVTAADETKSAFFTAGLLLFNFYQILQSSIQTTEAFVGLLEVFVALGLAVGIAAMGIVALRAVVERRSEIGLLRSMGYTQGQILRVFLLEYSYVALIGIGIGTGLALVLLYNATTVGVGFTTFVIPWLNLAIVLAVAYALVVAAIIGPSLKAARLPPAEAIRYSE